MSSTNCFGLGINKEIKYGCCVIKIKPSKLKPNEANKKNIQREKEKLRRKNILNKMICTKASKREMYKQ